jgi:hypothetical protein
MQVIILTPIYNDWKSFERLVFDLDYQVTQLDELKNIQFSILGINDASTISIEKEFLDWNKLKRINQIEMIHLAVNLGHQRAIATGLVNVAHQNADRVMVMDSDGEDLPVDAIRLISLSLDSPDAILVGQRTKRSESLCFRIGYFFYRLGFRALTGVGLPFGNFCILPNSAVNQLTYDSNIWNHFAAAINRSRFQRIKIPTVRGMRYFGTSHMNLTSLVIHGLSAMSVYSDRIAIRLIFSSIVISLALTIGVIVVSLIRLASDIAIPGWASQVVGTLGLGIFFSLGFSLLLAFITLQARQNVTFFPRVDSQKYIRSIEVWHSNLHKNT